MSLNCKYCGDDYPTESKLEVHEYICEKNPENKEGKPLCEFVLSDEEIERRKAALPNSVHDVLPANFWQSMREDIYDKEWADMQAQEKKTESKKPAPPQPEISKVSGGLDSFL